MWVPKAVPVATQRFMRAIEARPWAVPWHLPVNLPSWERVPIPVTVFDQEQNRYFQVFRQGTDIYQSEYALDSEGQERYKQTEKIAYVMGAGSEGMAYIVQKGNYLFEAPLSFYTRPKMGVVARLRVQQPWF